MANLPFATAQQAADIANISVSEIGIAANDFPTKRQLSATGAFDESGLASYDDDEFVPVNALHEGTVYVTVSAHVQSGRESYATVKAGSGTAGADSSTTVEEGTQVQFICTITDSDSASFIGWFKGGEQVSGQLSYSTAAVDGLSLEARLHYLIVSPVSLHFSETGGSDSFTVESDEEWTVE